MKHDMLRQFCEFGNHMQLLQIQKVNYFTAAGNTNHSLRSSFQALVILFFILTKVSFIHRTDHDLFKASMLMLCLPCNKASFLAASFAYSGC